MYVCSNFPFLPLGNPTGLSVGSSCKLVSVSLGEYLGEY